MAKQVVSVRTALDGDWVNVPTLPILCFVETGWGCFAKTDPDRRMVVARPKIAMDR